MNYNLQVRIKEIIELFEKIIRINYLGQEKFNERKFDRLPRISLKRDIVKKTEELKHKIQKQYKDELLELENKIDIINTIERKDFSIQRNLIAPYFFDESFMKEVVIKDPNILEGLSKLIIYDQGINWENGYNKLVMHAINNYLGEGDRKWMRMHIENIVNGFNKYGQGDFVSLFDDLYSNNRNELDELLKQHYKKSLLLDFFENNGQLISSDDCDLNDKEVPLTALLNRWEAIEKLPKLFQDDLLCCLFAIYNNGHAIKYVGEAFKDNEAIVELAIKINSIRKKEGNPTGSFDYRSVYPYISDRLKENEDLASMVSKKDGMLLQHMSDELKNNFEIVKSCVNNNGLAIQFGSPELRSNKELIDEAIKQNPAAVNHVAPENR
jgi:hypothetical protein